ncbi:MAG: hypothetical protein MZV65_16750 [Chromatiales bacterium]|nr:hypothetical protein [Chromatiales bacterium]
MHNLAELYGKIQNEPRANQWRSQILEADKRAPADLKTDQDELHQLGGGRAAGPAGTRQLLVDQTGPAAEPEPRPEEERPAESAQSLWSSRPPTESQKPPPRRPTALPTCTHSFSKALLESERPRESRPRRTGAVPDTPGGPGVSVRGQRDQVLREEPRLYQAGCFQ